MRNVTFELVLRATYMYFINSNMWKSCRSYFIWMITPWDILLKDGIMYIFLKQICLSHQFRQIMETQFLSFNASVTVTNFETLSACIFSWLEEYCKPQVSDSSNFHFTLFNFLLVWYLITANSNVLRRTWNLPVINYHGNINNINYSSFTRV